MNISTNKTHDIVQIHHDGNPTRDTAPCGALVAELYGGSFEERVSRAKVMAAAPELFEAARLAEITIRNASTEVVNAIRGSAGYSEWAETRIRLEEALVKARGEESQ